MEDQPGHNKKFFHHFCIYVCAVLLKNDSTLPLNSEDSILVVGELFEKMRYQGAGSSMINPTKITTPKNAFDSSKIQYEYVCGYKENSIEIDIELINDAVQKAENYDTILLFAGLTDYVESEGCDRKYMSLPDNQLAVLDNLIKTGRRVVVVLFGGSVVELPFVDHVNAVLHMFLPGQNGGTAVKQLIFGEKNPSGRILMRMFLLEKTLVNACVKSIVKVYMWAIGIILLLIKRSAILLVLVLVILHLLIKI